MQPSQSTGDKPAGSVHQLTTNPNEEPLDGTKGGALDQHAEDPMKEDDLGETSVRPSYEDRKLAQLIVDTVEQMKGLDNEVAQINAKKRELVEALEAHGIKRGAFRSAYAYHKADTDQRDGLDLSYAICRSALGMGINPDDFALELQKAG